jgi:gluconate 2-dehydrogenase alpha chain
MARDEHILGNKSLTQFDFCIIGSGAGGGTVAHVLTAAGKTVLVLEAGLNAFPHLDRPGPLAPPLHSNDEVKYAVRNFIGQVADLEPRTYRTSASQTATIFSDVNTLPKAVGGAFQHADCKTPRFTEVDFQLVSSMNAAIAANPGLAVPGFGADAASANFADWPFTYSDLEPFYTEAECLYGVQGDGSNPFAPPRSGPYPMPPGREMYLAVLLSQGALATSFLGGPLHPHAFPAAITSQFYDGRPPCNDCGPCSGFGCPNHAKGSPAVTTLRTALLSGRCQLRYSAHVTKLVNDGGHVAAVEYIDADGNPQSAVADAFVLSASAIESARLCLLSPTPSSGALGDSSGMVGRNLMFHLQTNVNGFQPRRVHGDRGRAVSTGISDFRGVEPGGASVRVIDVGSGPQVFMGGICEMSASQGLPITEDGEVYALQLPGFLGARRGLALKNAMRDLALGQHLFGLLMQAEDAPQVTNRVELDPGVRDVFGLPVPMITYASHEYERSARAFYAPFMRQVVSNAGATQTFLAPASCSNPAVAGPSTSRHIMGTLRMGDDPATSVVDSGGRFHDVDNLYAADGSVFVTSGGWNPTLTIIAVSLKIAHGIVGTQPSCQDSA